MHNHLNASHQGHHPGHLAMYFFSCFLLSLGICQAQSPNPSLLRNSSFEELAMMNKPPSAWDECSSTYGLFLFPADQTEGYVPELGKHALLMASEKGKGPVSISQLLPEKLLAGRAYSLSFFAATPLGFKSPFKEDERLHLSTRLRIKGIIGDCEQQIQIFNSDDRTTTSKWQVFEIKFKAPVDFDGIMIEAGGRGSGDWSILIDKLSLLPARDYALNRTPDVSHDLSDFEAISRIPLENPSFEGKHKQATQFGWMNCDDSRETPPDVAPDTSLLVFNEPLHGKTYLPFICRDNGTNTRLGQSLYLPLQKGRTYVLSCFLARSPTYIAPSRLEDQKVNYGTPLKLVLSAGNNLGAVKEILAETALIKHEFWQEYIIQFNPSANFKCIFLEAQDPNGNRSNGHLLIDHLSDLILIK
jgi:hypothetical protein